MKRFSSFTTTILFCTSLQAQNMQGQVVYMQSAALENYITVDTTEILVSYALNALDINDENTYIDLQRLEIGTTRNKYSSYFVHCSDSVFTDYWSMPNRPDRYPSSWWPKGRNGGGRWSELKHHTLFISNSNVRTYTREPDMAYNGYYDEPYPGMIWQIQEDTMTICDFHCQKATCNYHGRSFEAWFTSDISLSYGPWKFGGLPGLILKVYDVNHLYTFECVKIETVSFPMKSNKYLKHKPIEKKKVLEFEKKVNMNYVRTLNITLLDNNFQPTGKVPEDKPYDPLELE